MHANPIYALPTLLTLGNLLCGFFAIVALASASANPNQLAPGLVLLAVLLDGLDGVAARRMGLESRFGEILDCLADVVSFGVAPALLYLELVPARGAAHWAAAAWLLSATTLRLARFAAQTPRRSRDHRFEGLPCPAAAGVVAGAAFVELPPALLTPIVLGLGLLMVSGIRYAQPAALVPVRPIGFPTAALLALAAAFTLSLGGYAPLAICVLFVLSPLGRLVIPLFHLVGHEGREES